MKPTQILLAPVPWYDRADYPRLMQIFVDAADFPDSYDQWLANAEADCRTISEPGQKIVRVRIDPGSFQAWCAGNDMRPGMEARIAFAEIEAVSQHMAHK